MTRGGNATDIRVREIEPFFSVERSQTTMAFSRGLIDELTLCHVRALVETAGGKVGEGWGAILLSHPWALPGHALDAERRDQAMRAVVTAFCSLAADHPGYAHPIDLFMELQQALPDVAGRALAALGLDVRWPHLASLVCASPADAALHDAFGIANRIPTYHGYGPDFCHHDLSRHLGPAFRGRFVDDYMSRTAAPRVPFMHNVGLGDPLTVDEERTAAGGGPTTASLERWIEAAAIRLVKAKLRGTDAAWDMERILAIHRVGGGGERPAQLSLDPNEACESADYMVDLLLRLRADHPRTFDAITYVEQPLRRDLLGVPGHDVHRLAAIKPVLLDEGFCRLEDLSVAARTGWSGVALKTCKTQSLMALTVPVARRMGMLHPVQDLTNLGIAIVQSVGLAARLPGPSPVESNGRQYFPDASLPEAAVHPCIAAVEDGGVSTDSMGGDGLGYAIERIPRPIFRAGCPGPRSLGLES